MKNKKLLITAYVLVAVLAIVSVIGLLNSTVTVSRAARCTAGRHIRRHIQKRQRRAKPGLRESAGQHTGGRAGSHGKYRRSPVRRRLSRCNGSAAANTDRSERQLRHRANDRKSPGKNSRQRKTDSLPTDGKAVLGQVRNEQGAGSGAV